MLSRSCTMPPSHPRQSYDVLVKLKVEGTTQVAQGTYDLKNPYFRYSGMGAAKPSGRQCLFKCILYMYCELNYDGQEL